MGAEVKGFYTSNCLSVFHRCGYRSCSRNPSESILARVKKLGQTFREHYSLGSEDTPASHIGAHGSG